MNATKERRVCNPEKCGRTMINAAGQPAGPDEYAYCRRCDRLRCGQCGKHVQNPTATHCACGKDIRIGNRLP